MLYCVSSRYRDTGSYNRFRISITIPERFRRLKLLSLQIPMSWYVINSSNNAITFAETTSPLVVRQAIIPEGNYSYLLMIAAIGAAMSLVGTVPYVTTFNNVDNKITISAPISFQINWAAERSTYYQLGFDKTLTPFSFTHTGDRGINLSPSGMYLLEIQGLGISNCLVSRTQSFPGTYPICLTGDSYEFFEWTNANYEPILVGTNQANLFINLMDQNGVSVPLNEDWSILFQLLD